jgi:hypothetical protein
LKAGIEGSNLALAARVEDSRGHARNHPGGAIVTTIIATIIIEKIKAVV